MFLEYYLRVKMNEILSKPRSGTGEGRQEQKIDSSVELENSSWSGNAAQNDGSDKKHPKGFLPLIGAAQVLGLLPVLLIVYWAFSRAGGLAHYAFKMSNWHMILSSVSCVYLIGNAILTFRMLRNWPKQTVKMVHAMVATINGILAVASVWAAFSFHARSGIGDLYSVHSWIGMITLFMYISQMFAGLYVFLYPGLSIGCRASFMPYHRFAGQVTFALAIAAAMTGINEKAIFKLGKCYEEKTFEGVLLNLCSVLFTLFGVIVIYVAASSVYRRNTDVGDDLDKTSSAE